MIATTVSIPDNQIGVYSIIFFNKPVTNTVSINLGESVQKRLGNESLTHETALRILKEIKFKSDVISLFTKPIVFIPLSLAVTTVGFICSAFSINSFALTFFGLLFSSLGGGMIGVSLKFTLTGFLSKVSKFYKLQSQLAENLIKQLETNPQASVVIEKISTN